MTSLINGASVNGDDNFVLENILRSLSGSALGSSASIDGDYTFATIDSQRNDTHSCMTRWFPHFLGSSSGFTKYDTFEIDSNGNFGVGGSSSDPALVTTAGNLLIGLF